jgi:hypothetical protein
MGVVQAKSFFLSVDKAIAAKMCLLRIKPLLAISAKCGIIQFELMSLWPCQHCLNSLLLPRAWMIFLRVWAEASQAECAFEPRNSNSHMSYLIMMIKCKMNF